MIFLINRRFSEELSGGIGWISSVEVEDERLTIWVSAIISGTSEIWLEIKGGGIIGVSVIISRFSKFEVAYKR